MLRLADYVYYSTIFKGTLAEDVFNRSILTASAYLSKITFGRIEAYALDFSDDVKHVACLCAELVQDIEDAKIDGRQVASISNDGYAVSFADASSESGDELHNRIYRIARIYLPSELFYAGVVL